MDIQQALDKLFSLHQFGIKLGLENINKLLKYIGNPEKKLRAVHIAGSNGKGSTASFLASILQEKGYKTALYTSPHFRKFNERVRINGIEIEDEYILSFMSGLEEYIDKNSPTFFELTTAMAFKYFAEHKVDISVIETGLGGRLDATNVLDPAAMVITSISKEHTNILGEKYSDIAREKAGILKAGKPLFTGFMPEEALEEIKRVSNEKKISDLINLSDHFKKSDSSLRMDSGEFDLIKLPLEGKYQRWNAALALLIAEKVFGINDTTILKSGLYNVLSNTGFQGRYEYYHRRPDIIFDAAHNEEGIEMLLDLFEEKKNNYKEKSVIFGAMKDKKLHSMFYLLASYFDNFYVTDINYERSATIDDLLNLADKTGIKVIPLNNPAKFIREFKNSNNASCLLITGSIYLIGQIKQKL